MTSIVKISDVLSGYVFEWFYYVVGEPSGDGAAIICCGNPEQTADAFIDWWEKRYLPIMKSRGYKLDEFVHPRDSYESDGVKFVNYHDSNENYMFADRKVDLLHGDVSFVIEGDCCDFYGNVVIEAVKGVENAE
jgi:hypothetical protein